MPKEGAKVYLHLTEKCNSNCKHCYLGSKKNQDFLSWEQIEKSLRFFREKGFSSLQITGGEPYFSAYFYQTISLANKLGYDYIGVSTNGTRPEIIDKLTPQQVQKFSFSLDGATPETDDYIRGTGHFNTCILSIKKAVQKKFRVHVIFCINKINVMEIEKVINLADSMGINQLSFNFTSYMGNAKKNKQILITPKDWIKIRKKIQKIDTCKKTSLKIPYCFITKAEYKKLFKESFICPIDKPRQIIIFPNGNIYHCCLLTEQKFLKAGNVDKEKIVYNENGPKEIKQNFPSPCPAYLLLTQNTKINQEKIIPICVYLKKIIKPKG